MANPTVVKFRAASRQFPTSKAAYIWLLNRFFEAKPDAREVDAFDVLLMPVGTKRSYFGRTPQGLFAHNPKLAENPNNYYVLANGLCADVNLPDTRKLKNLQSVAQVVGLEEQRDWEWQALS